MSERGGARLAWLLLVVLIAASLSACTESPTEAGTLPDVSSEAPSESPSEATSEPPSPSLLPSIEPPAAEPRTNARIVRVVDGDTVEAAFRGRVIDVRLIGVDTPETVHPSEPVGCFGPAASRFTERQLEGKRVRLTFDVEREDRYGRTLAYVWLNDKLFNERLVREGFATISTFPPNVRYVDRFLVAQRFARNNNRGLWGGCDPGPFEVPEFVGGGGGNCDESYPDVCIKPYPPDLDCADVPFSAFRVTGSDPHGFDGDDDGIGCES